jgi:hypothetical protein
MSIIISNLQRLSWTVTSIQGRASFHRCPIHKLLLSEGRMGAACLEPSTGSAVSYIGQAACLRLALGVTTAYGNELLLTIAITARHITYPDVTPSGASKRWASQFCIPIVLSCCVTPAIGATTCKAKRVVVPSGRRVEAQLHSLTSTLEASERVASRSSHFTSRCPLNGPMGGSRACLDVLKNRKIPCFSASAGNRSPHCLIPHRLSLDTLLVTCVTSVYCNCLLRSCVQFCSLRRDAACTLIHTNELAVEPSAAVSFNDTGRRNRAVVWPT